MSEEYNHIDDLFKKGLGHYAPEPQPDTWEKIAQRTKETRPKALWWKTFNGVALLAGILLLMTGAFFYLSTLRADEDNKKANGTSNTHVAATTASQSPSAENDQQLASASADNDKGGSVQPIASSIENKEDKKEVNTSSANANAKQQTTLADPSKESTVGNNIKTPTNAPDLGTATLSVSKTGKPKNALIQQATSAKATIAKLQTNQTIASKNEEDGESQMSSVEETIAAKQKGNSGNRGRKSPATKQQYVDEMSSDGEKEVLSTNTLLRQNGQINLITSSSVRSAAEALPQLNRPPDCPPAERDAAANKLYWEVYTSADVAYKKYADTANSLLLQKRKASTSFISAFSFGARITRVFNNGISIRAGINYSQINERFSFIQSNIVQTTYVLDPNTGDTIGFNTVTGTRFKNTYNRYRFIDVPLLIGYELGNGRFHANISAGPVINLYSWQRGEQLDTAFKPVVITTGKGHSLFQYKTNAGLGFMGSASLWYKLNDRMHLLAEPYFRYSLAPMNKEGLSLQERFNSIGLRLGLRFDID